MLRLTVIVCRQRDPALVPYVYECVKQKHPLGGPDAWEFIKESLQSSGYDPYTLYDFTYPGVSELYTPAEEVERRYLAW